MSKQIVYPEDITCIVEPTNGKGAIFIGNLEAAQNINTLQKNQIKALLTAAKGVDIGHPKQEIPYFLYVPAEDHDNFDISKYFTQAANYIHECLQKTNILVHCLAGVSRSVSLVIAYFIKYRQLTFDQAHHFIKSKRKIIHPNDGFIRQLKKLEQQCKSPSRSEQNHQSYSPSRVNDTSPSKYYQKRYEFSYSPNKYLNHTNDEPKITQYKQPTYENYSPDKNPQFIFKNRPQTYSKVQYAHTQNYSPTKLRRLSSMNTNYQYEHQIKPVDKYSQYEKYQDYRGNEMRPRAGSQYTPLESIQNRSSYQSGYPSVSSDIDKKIEQIRKKYQQYSSTNYKPRTNFNQNNLQDQFGIKKMSSLNYDQPGRQSIYGSIRSNLKISNFSQHRLKKMTSLQDY